MTMTLDEFLGYNVAWVEEEAPKVKAGGDLYPFLTYIRPDGAVVMVLLKDGMGDGASKDVVMAWCRGQLRRDDAQMYALVSAAWYVRRRDPAELEEMSRVFAQEGSGGRYRDERRECYLVSVGDRQRSLVAMLDVKRDYKGKIRGLVRAADAAETMRGRMVNLLSTE